VDTVTVALANKMARIAWALMTHKEVYHAEGRVVAGGRHGGDHGLSLVEPYLTSHLILSVGPSDTEFEAHAQELTPAAIRAF